MKQHYGIVKSAKILNVISAGLMLLAGLLLLVVPNLESTTGQRILLGILFGLTGAAKLFGYFSKDPYRLAFQFDLALGIFFLVRGAALLFFSHALLSLLPVLVGVFTVVGGVFKLQTAFDARRFGMGKWWGMLLLSLAVIAIGAILLVRPFQSAMLAVQFMGLAILLSGIQDLTTTAYTVKTKPNGVIIDVDDFREV